MRHSCWLLTCIVALAAALSFAACGGGGDGEAGATPTPDVQATQTATAAEAVAAAATAEARAIDATATAEALAPVQTATAEALSSAATATAEAEQQAAIGLSRDNPVPAGQAYTIPEGWEVTVMDFIPDATQMVLAENQFNDPPAAGKKFAMVRLRGTNVSAESPDFDPTFSFRVVGSLNVPYSTFDNSCGVIPGEFENTEAFQGGTVEGSICFEVGADETDFVLFTEFLLTFDEESRRWFAVQ